MSSRGYATWYQTVVTAAQQVGFDPPMQTETAGPFFVETILDPHFRTDLYELDLSTRAIRRLTDLGRSGEGMDRYPSVGGDRDTAEGLSFGELPWFHATNVPTLIVDGLSLLQAELGRLATQLKGLLQGPSCCCVPG
jgi:hypothetical protein